MGVTAADPHAGRAFSRRSGALTAVVVAPDGATLFTGGDDGVVRQWDRLTGRLRPGQLTQHDGPIADLAVTPDGARVVSAGADGMVRVWDTTVHRPVEPPINGDGGPVLSIALTGAGDHVVSAGFDGSIQLSDLASGGLVGNPMSTHTGPVFGVDITPEGTRMVAVGVAGTVSLWDLRSGRLLGESTEHHLGPAFTVVVTADGSRVVSCGQDGTIRVWETDSQPPLRLLNVTGPGDGSPIFALAVTPDGTRALTGAEDGAVVVWDMASGQIDREALIGHTGPVRAIAVPDGEWAVSVGDDATARLWDLHSRSPIGDPLQVQSSLASYPVAPTGSTTYSQPPPHSEPQPRYAGVATDDESSVDQLGVTKDVHTMAALLAAVGTKPPLSIALLGNWGAGKSTFMRLVQARVSDLARSAANHPGQTGFVANVWQVRFNAWHYSDDHLWVGLVEHLFRELQQQPEGRPSDAPNAQQRAELEVQLAAEKARHARLDRTLQQVDHLDPGRGWFGWLTQPLRSVLVLREAGRSAWSQLRSPQAVLGFALIVAGAAAVVLTKQFGAGLLGWLAGAMTVATGFLTSAMAMWRKIQQLTAAAREKLIAEKRRRMDEIDRIESELNRLDPARELDRLLIEITSTDRYERYRGLTGRIHHDLSRLSDQLSASAGDDGLHHRRIILYVDDLDRCVAKRVVEVLQAVNLLLSMPLFTVVVAVDPRWLLRALDEQHGTLLNARAIGQTHSLDYLDKIFHVPFALAPMSDRGEDYLRLMLPQVEYLPRPTEPAPNAPSTFRSPSPPPGPAPSRPAPPTPDPSRSATGTPAPPTSPAPPLEVRTEGLRLRPEEWEFLPRLAPLIPTPRAAKKLSNLYRLVRISIPDGEVESYIGGPDGGPFQAAALLLAAVVSAPGQADALLKELSAIEADTKEDIVPVLRGIDEAASLTTSLADLIADIRLRGTPICGDPNLYISWALYVARYSFATYHLFTGDRSSPGPSRLA